MPEQLFPLIKEIHGKVYEKGTEISPLATEFSVQRSDTKEITSIRADITVLVDKKDIYHFECEIENDGTMVMRMFEYDVHIALSYSEIADEEEIKEKHLCVLIPFLPLRFRKKMPPVKKNCSVTKEESTPFYEEIILLLEVLIMIYLIPL